MNYVLLANGKVAVEGSKEDVVKYFGCTLKKQRNIDQNGLYWKFLYQLSNKLKIGIEELHKQMLRDYSVRYEILVPSDTTLRGIEYYDIKSKIVKDNKEYYVYHVYTPSHELKTDEFAILLNGLIQECEQQGIPTLKED